MTTSIHEVADDALFRFSTMIRTDAEIAAHLEQRRQENYLEIEGWLLRMGFPKRSLETREFQGEKWLEARERVRGAILKRGTIWLLCGNRGAGKTTLAVVMARHAAREGKRVRFATALEMLEEIRISGLDGIRKFTKSDLLVIDEVAERSKLTDWQGEMLTAVVRARHDGGKDTMMTANGSSKEVQARLGDTIRDRMCEGGGVIQFHWRSFRHG